jgi:lipid A 3-O-deacylase
MRSRNILGLMVLAATFPSGSWGAEFAPHVPYLKPPSSSVQASNVLSELRIGLSAQDPWGPEGNNGSANVTGEILFAKPFTSSDAFTSYFIPRPHLGGSINASGHTSFAYAGLTWTIDVNPHMFIEASFGGAFHNGDRHSDALLTPHDRQALGCSPLFRDSESVGFRLSAHWSVVATVEHLSNGGLCNQNRGLTNVGARVGYSF